MAWNHKVKGRIWKFGRNIDTDQILPGYAMAAPVDKLKEYALAGSNIPDFAKKMQPGDIIVAEENFGCGSSREQAPVALQQAGVGLILAKSFARIFRRNAINIGLPVMICEQVDQLAAGATIEVDILNAVIKLESGETIFCQPLSPSVLETLQAGGLIEKIWRQFNVSAS